MRQRLWRLLTVIILVPLVLLPGAVHFLALTALETPEKVCGQCHAPRVAMGKWSLSTHRGASCDECHSPAKGVINKETAVLQLLAQCVKMSVTGETRVTKVPKEVCLKCHSKFYDIKSLSSCKHVAHPHSECSHCHRGLVHKTYDRDALVLAIGQRGESLTVTADFPKRLGEKFGEKAHFQHGFMKSMSFCGNCHKMSPTTAITQKGRAMPRSPVCENCHVRY